ncbi:MAG: STAS domain-containing protein [Ferruginibacter sp.]
MNVKTDTKEKFTVITPEEPILTAILTAELNNMLREYLQKDIPHIVLNLKSVGEIDEKSADILANLQQNFYEHDFSFVMCTLQPPVEALFDKMELLEILNVTPTESEAWDIVQMEEIERELLSGMD